MSAKLYVLSEGFKSNSCKNLTDFNIESISAVKNSTAAFQIAVGNGGKNCRINLSATPSLPTHILNPVYRVEVKSKLKIKLYIEKYLKDENKVMYADILSNQREHDYSGAELPLIWADAEIPESLAGGKYGVEVNLYTCVGATNETKVESLSLNIEVKDFVMPSPVDYKIYVDLWQHNSNLARYYGVELWSDEHFQKISLMLETLADLGQKSVTVLAGDCPWQGWGCYIMQNTPANLFEYSIIKSVKTLDGKFKHDFSAFKRYVDLCAEHGIKGDITIYGLAGIWKMPLFVSAIPKDYPEKVLIRYIDEADGCAKYMDNGADILDYIKELFKFLKKEKLFDRVYIGADEPSDTKAYAENVKLLLSIDKDIKFKMAIDHASVIREFANELYSCVSSFPCSCNEHEFLTKFKTDHPDRQALWYVCNIPDKPNTVFKSSACETRLIGALNYLLGFDGFLRWAYYCWTLEPTADICYNTFGLPTGDVCFVYPDKSGGVSLSVRYKHLKRGIEDFELINLLKSVDKAAADKAIEFVLFNRDVKTYMKNDKLTCDGIYSDDYNDYINMREFIIDRLILKGDKE